VHPGDLAGGFSDLEMTWLLYCTGAATGKWNEVELPETMTSNTPHMLLGCSAASLIRQQM